jgi:hypothetical protein
MAEAASTPIPRTGRSKPSWTFLLTSSREICTGGPQADQLRIAWVRQVGYQAAVPAFLVAKNLDAQGQGRGFAGPTETELHIGGVEDGLDLNGQSLPLGAGTNDERRRNRPGAMGFVSLHGRNGFGGFFRGGSQSGIGLGLCLNF